MKNASFFLSFWLLATAAAADVTRQNGRVLLSYDFSEDHATAVCIGQGYYRHECRSVPVACGICSPSDTRAECDAKVAAATQEQLDASLPLISRLTHADQRDICAGSETDPQCEAKISAHYGALALDRGHCTVTDPNAVTIDEWKACEFAAAARGLAPSPDLDELPHFLGCLAFLDHKTGWPLRESRDAGRRWLASDAAPDVDTTDDEP